MILDHKLQRMFNDFKIGQLNSERPLHQTAVLFKFQQFRVFLPILEKLSYALDNSLLHAEEEAKFSEVALVFVNHCVEFIRKHRCLFLAQIQYCLVSTSCPSTCALFLPKY